MTKSNKSDRSELSAGQIEDDQLDAISGGRLSLWGMIAGAEQGYSTGKSVGGTPAGLIGGAVGAVAGLLFG